jgi:hypothetical protein
VEIPSSISSGKRMKLRGVLLTCIFSTLLTSQARLSPRFETVYLLEMANELDQHIASRLTSTRTMWVVLDPSKADSILTDSLDDTFWNWLTRNYPPAAGTDASGANRSVPQKYYGSPTGAHHRGTIFLVDPRARVVLWSTYELPKDSTPAELDRAASRINTGLRGAFGKK